MPRSLTCACGHRWIAAGGQENAASIVCPKCGVRFKPRENQQAPLSDEIVQTNFIPNLSGQGNPKVEASLPPTTPLEDPSSIGDVGLQPTGSFAFPIASSGISGLPATTAPPSIDSTRDGITPTQFVPEMAAIASREAAPKMPVVEGYVLLSELGRGGMGVVYKARQIKLNRVVALKMVLSGAHLGRLGLDRFRAEAKAVASLQHPNIVQIHEVGEQDEHPYFSLEFVDGGSLAQQIQGKPQSVPFAAQMVETLARAMHCAHEHEIIHRDLKPANVLMTRAGVPKITDFGLAKRLDDDSSQTRTGDVMGTPNYMAPEQAQGLVKEFGPCTDVYALGVILYELLTGQAPFRGETPVDTLLQVSFDEPVPPSRLRPKIPRDLETICLKCLEKPPKKRYLSAAALADDLAHFRAGEPIRARPTGAFERGLKWARRNRSLSALVGVSILTVVVVLSGSLSANVLLQKARKNAEDQKQVAEENQELAERETARAHAEEIKARKSEQRANEQRELAVTQHKLAQRERARAEANYREARQAVDLMLTRVAQEHLAHIPGMMQERQKLLEAALAFYEKIPREDHDSAVLSRETGRSYRRVGDIATILGDHKRAEQAYGQAIVFFTRLVKDKPDDFVYQADLAASLFQRGRLWRDTGKLLEARKDYEAALKCLEDLTRQNPRDPEARAPLARTLNDLGQLLRNIGKFAEAKAAYDRALELQATLVADFPKSQEYALDLAGSHNDRGILFRATGALDQAEAVTTQAVAGFRKLHTQNPENVDYRWRLAAAYSNLGSVQRGIALQIKGDLAYLTKARENLQVANDLREKLAISFPTVPIYQRELANGYCNLAVVLMDGKKFEEADKNYREAETIYRKLVKDYPKIPDHRSGLGGVLDNRAVVVRRQGQGLASLELLKQASVLHDEALRNNPKNPAYRLFFVSHCNILAETLVREGKAAAALQAIEDLPRQFPNDGHEAYHAAVLLARFVELLRDNRIPKIPQAERKPLADSWADKSVNWLRKSLSMGYKNDPSPDKDPAFDSLRDHDGFRKAIMP